MASTRTEDLTIDPSAPNLENRRVLGLENGGRMTRVTPALALALLLTSGATHAQEADSAERAAAVELFDAGQRMMESGQIAEACPKFAESYRLDPQLGAVLHLGGCLEQAGKLASAYAAFREAAEFAEKKGDERQSVAEERSRALEPRLNRLTVEVPEASRVPDLKVFRDGLALAGGSWGTPIAVDSGEHKVEARAPGHKPWSVTVQVSGEGSTKRIEVPALEPEPEPEDGAAPAGAPDSTTALEADTGRAGSPLRTIGFVLGGVGVVGLGAGVFFLVQKGNELDDRDAVCPSHVDCEPGSQDRIDALTDDARSAQTLSTVSFVAGGVLLAAGATLVLTAPGSKASERPSGFRVLPILQKQAMGVFAEHSF